MSLYDVYAACAYRLPLGERLPHGGGVPDDGAAELIGTAAESVRTALARPLAEIFSADRRSQSAKSKNQAEESPP